MNKLKIIASAALALSASFAFADRLANHRFVQNKFEQHEDVATITYDKYLNPVTNYTKVAVFTVSTNGTEVVGLHVIKHPARKAETGDVTIDGGGAFRVGNAQRIIVYDKYLNRREDWGDGEETQVEAKGVAVGRAYGSTNSVPDGVTMYDVSVSYDSHLNKIVTETPKVHVGKDSVWYSDTFFVDGTSFSLSPRGAAYSSSQGSPLYKREGSIFGNGSGITILHPTMFAVRYENGVVKTNEVLEVKHDGVAVRGVGYHVETDKYGNRSVVGESTHSSNGFGCGRSLNGAYHVTVNTNGFFVGGVDITTYITASDGTKFRAVNNGGTLSWEVVQQ